MREIPSQEEKPARRARIWPHALVLIAEMLFLWAAFNYFERGRRTLWDGRYDSSAPSHVQWFAAAYALSFVIGILTAYQLVQTLRRNPQVLRLNARRCQLMVTLGVIAVGARAIFELHGITFILWGLLCLWAYKSLDFAKRPFDRE
jgi:hypothetical protein